MFSFRASDGREAAASSQTVHAAVVIALFVDARRFFFCSVLGVVYSRLCACRFFFKK